MRRISGQFSYDCPQVGGKVHAYHWSVEEFEVLDWAHRVGEETFAVEPMLTISAGSRLIRFSFS